MEPWSKENKKITNLDQLHRIQNKIFLDDCLDDFREQHFLYYLGNHPTLFQSYINQGQLTIAEMNYIVEHFSDYNVDPRTFAISFSRAMHESLPRYNMLKAIELQDELFDLVESSYTREIITDRTNHLAQDSNVDSTTVANNDNDSKSANRTLPMQTSGQGFDNVVSWQNGASGIQEQKDVGSSTVHAADVGKLNSWNKEDGNVLEKYNRHDDAVDHIDRIWSYIIKPKAINWLTAELSCAFVLCY